MTNEELVKKVKELLKTDADLRFLLALNKKDMERLVACIRGRLDQASEKAKR
jgi:ribosomal protein L29